MARKRPRVRKSKKRKSPRAFASLSERRKATKAFLISPANGCCQTCKYATWSGNLTFHHKDEASKHFNISEKLLSHDLWTLIKEASKCIVLCHNCHGEIHAGLRNADHIAPIDFRAIRIPIDIVKWHRCNN